MFSANLKLLYACSKFPNDMLASPKLFKAFGSHGFLEIDDSKKILASLNFFIFNFNSPIFASITSLSGDNFNA